MVRSKALRPNSTHEDVRFDVIDKTQMQTNINLYVFISDAFVKNIYAANIIGYSDLKQMFCSLFL